MAEGKKSFVLYTDLIYTVKKLPKEKQAELFVLILEYVNDMNPKTEDLLLEVAFEPIKRQLKRDLQKYEERATRSRENGSKGGRPSKNSNPEEPKKPNGLFQNPTEPRKPDNVTVTDNDNVNVTVNNNRAFVADVNSDPRKFRQYLFNEIIAKPISKDQLFKRHKIDVERRNEIWEEFIENASVHTPRIEDEKHAWNTFKLFIERNGEKYRIGAEKEKRKVNSKPS